MPIGARLDVDGVCHVVVRDGQVVSDYVIMDQMQLARQLGLLPAAGTRIDRGAQASFLSAPEQAVNRSVKPDCEVVGEELSFPGSLGELGPWELGAYAESGYCFSNDGPIARLAAAIRFDPVCAPPAR